MEKLIPNLSNKVKKVFIPENLSFRPTIPFSGKDRSNLKAYFEYLGLPELGKQIKYEDENLRIRLKTYTSNTNLLQIGESSILNVIDFEDEGNIEEECIGQGKVFDLRFEFMFAPPSLGEGYIDYTFQFKTRDRVELVMNIDLDIVGEYGNMLKDFMKYMKDEGGFSETTNLKSHSWFEAKEIFQSMLLAVKNVS